MSGCPRLGLTVAMLACALALGCPAAGRTRTVIFAVHGMVCDSCAEAIEKRVEAIDGVIDVEVDRVEGRAVVVFEEARVDDAAIEASIDALGYDAIPVVDELEG